MNKIYAKFTVLLCSLFFCVVNLSSQEKKSLVPAEKLRSLAVAHGDEYIKQRDNLLREYDLAKINPEEYEHPASKLAATILKQRQLQLPMFDQLHDLSTKWRKECQEGILYRFSSDHIDEILRRHARWPKGQPTYKSTEDIVSEIWEKLTKEGKSEAEIAREQEEATLPIQEENQRIYEEARRKELPIRTASKVAVLELIWKLSVDTTSYTLEKRNPFDAERFGILMFLEYLSEGIEGIYRKTDEEKASWLKRFDEYGGKNNVAWVMLEYIYNIDNISFIDSPSSWETKDDRTLSLMYLLDGLKNLECYNCVSLLDKLRDEFKGADAGTPGKADHAREIELLEKAIEEFKAQNAPQFEWEGIIRKWPKTERRIEPPAETKHDDDNGLIID
jgi:hypothetical protein